VFDTGIQASHSTFQGGNVEWGFDAISDPPLRDDPHGHGTYIAGLIGGMNHGLCRGVTVVDVRVMGEDGYGYVHDVIAGLDYAVGKYVFDCCVLSYCEMMSSYINIYIYLCVGRIMSKSADYGRAHAVINLSMSGPSSKILKYALYSVSKGIYCHLSSITLFDILFNRYVYVVVLVVTAVGDTETFSCFKSPGNSPFVLSVAATSRYSELKLPESNFGDCIDINAPGDRIRGPWIGPSNNEEIIGSGSSVANALMTGMALQLLADLNSDKELLDLFDKHVLSDKISVFLKDALTISFRAIFPMDQDDGVENMHEGSWKKCEFTRNETLHAMMNYIFSNRLKYVETSNQESKPAVYNMMKQKLSYRKMKQARMRNR
jgi:subtilisin family serine protease